MTRPFDVSVVIRTYTEARWNFLVTALTSLQFQSMTPGEIIVVVDHNPDLFARVQKYFPQVLAVENHAARGSSGAWNSGVAAAKGDIIAFLDDDAIASPDWLECLMAGYDHPRVVGVGGTIAPMWLDGQPAWFPGEFNWVVGCTYLGLPQTVAPVRNLIGCNMSFRRQVFDVIGRFRDGIGHVGGRPIGGDETEFCIRIRQRWPDKVLLYKPDAKVYHQIPKSRASWNYFRWRCYLEGRSKALVSGFVGPEDGLASEWVYTARTLPHGVQRSIVYALRHRNIAGFGRAGAIIAGLAITTAGFLIGSVARLWTPRIGWLQ